MRAQHQLIVALAVVCLATSAWGATLVVPDDFSTIQEGVVASAGGDTVLVRPGTYAEVVHFGGKSLVLKSTDGPEATIIQYPTGRLVDENDGVIYFEPGSDATTIVEGFTIDAMSRCNGVSCTESDPQIRNCIVQNGLGSYDGGGFWLQHCRPTIENNIIRHNRTWVSGGGIFIRLDTTEGAAKIVGNTIYGNVAGNAGGICAIEGRGAYIARNIIKNNTVSPTYTEGVGAVSIRAADCSLINNTIVRNYAGITVIASDNALILNNIVAWNTRGIWVNNYAGPSTVTLGYNLVWLNGTTNYENIAPGATDVWKIPGFVSGTVYLSAESPCINSGDPDPVYNDPDESRNDIGALTYFPVEPRQPATFYVPGQFATISQALAQAVDFDTILVGPGDYEECLEFDGKSLVLKSTEGAKQTVLSFPSEAYPIYDGGVIHFFPGSTQATLIDGFTIDGMTRTNGVSCIQSDPVIRNCIVENGHANWDGGGFWLQECRPLVENNIIRYNETGVSGGGIFIRLGEGGGTAKFIGNTIYSNSAGNSGGICAIEGRGARIERNLFYRNSIGSLVTEAEGAVFIRADDCSVINNTITGHRAGITLAAASDAEVRNNLIVFNTNGGIIANDYVGPSTATLAYNDVWYNGSDYLNIPPGVTDLSVDPLFNRCGSTLLPESPCIDAGDPDPVYNDPDGSRNDIGAIPYDPAVPNDSRTIRVPAEFATIQAAIDAAGCQDTILVGPGEYAEQLQFMSKSLVLKSTDGPEATRIIPPAALKKPGQSGEFDDHQATTPAEMPRDCKPGALIVLVAGSDKSTLIEGFTLDGQDNNEGIHCTESDPTVRNCIIEHCVGSYDGGGLWFQFCEPLVENNIIRFNRTPISGGGIFIRLGYGYAPRFVGNQIYGNVGGNAGGICAIEGEGAIIERNLIYDNHVDPPHTEGWGAVTIRADNCRILNNTIVTNDGGVTIVYSQNVDVRNNIIMNNLAGGLIRNDYCGAPVNLVHEYNDVWNNNGKDYVLLEPGIGEISADPMLASVIEPGAVYSIPDFLLQSGSPCIDAGDPNSIYNDPDGSRADMGALSAAPTVVSKPDGGLKFALDQNYPNPCNPSTVIKFSLPAPARTSLVVYNMLGQEVRQLVDGDLSAGSHRIEWNGRDDRGESVATGVYFYRLTAGGDERTNKMLMIK